MPIYKVTYSSMTASYGPGYIEADSEEEAKIKYGGTAFSSGERAVCMSARPVSEREIAAALRAKSERDNDD